MLLGQLYALFGFLASLWGCAASTNSCDINMGTTNDGAEREVRDTGTLDYAQSFQVSKTTDVSSVHIYIYRSGNPTALDFSNGDTLNVYIATDNSGEPSSTAYSSSVSFNYQSLNNLSTLTPAYLQASFSSSVSLTASTTYWVVIAGGYGANLNSYVVWRGNSTNEYDDGKAMEYDGTNWADVPDDGAKTPATIKDFLIKVGCD